MKAARCRVDRLSQTEPVRGGGKIAGCGAQRCFTFPPPRRTERVAQLLTDLVGEGQLCERGHQPLAVWAQRPPAPASTNPSVKDLLTTKRQACPEPIQRQPQRRHLGPGWSGITGLATLTDDPVPLAAAAVASAEPARPPSSITRFPRTSPTKLGVEVKALICQLLRARPRWGARRIRQGSRISRCFYMSTTAECGICP